LRRGYGDVGEAPCPVFGRRRHAGRPGTEDRILSACDLRGLRLRAGASKTGGCGERTVPKYKIRSTKHEIRNDSAELAEVKHKRPNEEMTKRSFFLSLVIWVCFAFRASDFGFN